MVESNGQVQNRFEALLKPKVLIMICLLVLIIITMSLAFFLQQNKSDAAVIVNGEIISRDNLFEAMYKKVGQDVLGQMIRYELAMQKAKTLDISVGEEELGQEIQAIIDESFDSSVEEFHETLRYFGYTLESFRNELGLDLLIRKVAMASAELAGQYSIDDYNKDEGGYLGFIMRGMLVESFEEAAFELEIGVISEPIESEFVFHIIEVLGRAEATEVQFEDVKDEVYEYMIDDMIEQFMQTLFDDAEITYLLEGLSISNS